MDSPVTVKNLIKLSDRLWTKKDNINSLNQELAELFYPERASFTQSSPIDGDLAANLFDSYTVRVRRDLGNAFGAMLRPRGQEWFFPASANVKPDKMTAYGRAWLQGVGDNMRGAIYDNKTGFVRALKETDHAYATFGNGVVTIEPDYTRMSLHCRAWPLELVAWDRDHWGQPSPIVRKDCMTARQIAANKKNQLPKEIKKCAGDPDKEDTEFDILHVVMPRDQWEDYSGEKNVHSQWVSIYVAVLDSSILRVEQIASKRYIIPQWQTIEGSPYSISPAATTALADARMIQKLAFLVMEAAEKKVDPPTIARADAVLSGINLMSGATTWVNKTWDESKGQAVRAFDFGENLAVGEDLMQRIRTNLTECFYLNKLNLPQGSGKTQYEAEQLVQEFIRSAIPIFEPLETEYNQPVLEATFAEMMALGAFGPKDDIPDELAGTDIEFKFNNILQQAIEKQKGQKMQNLGVLLQVAAQMEAAMQTQSGQQIKVVDMFRDAGMADTPAIWWNEKQEPQEQRAAQQDAMQGQAANQNFAELVQGAQGVKTIADATNATAQATGTLQQAMTGA